MHPRKEVETETPLEVAVSENKMAFEERKQLNREIRRSETKIEKLEKEIADVESRIAETERQMAAGIVNETILKDYGEAKKRLETCMADWETENMLLEELKSKK